MHECVRETPLRFSIALLYLRALLWRSIDSIGGLSRLSTNHGVWSIFCSDSQTTVPEMALIIICDL